MTPNENQKLRIAFHANGTTAGGLGSFVLQLASAFTKAGHTVVILLDQPGPFEEQVTDYETVKLETKPICIGGFYLGPIRLPNPIAAASGLRQSLRAQRVVQEKLSDKNLDVIIGVGMSSPALLAKSCGRLGIKLITCIHGIGNRNNDLLQLRARFSAYLLNKADYVVGVSNACQERYLPFLKVPNQTIYNACRRIETDPKFRVSFCRKHNLPDTIKIVGGFGRIQFDKGHHVLIEAFSKLSASHPDLVLCIGGSPYNAAEQEYMESLELLARELDIADRCFFLGHLPPSEFFSIADLFCHTYLGEEALSYAILESISAGCPVVAVDRGGPREIIQPEQSGQLIDSNNPALLANAIEKYLKQPAFAAALSSNASKLVVDGGEFDPALWPNKWLDLIKQVCR